MLSETSTPYLAASSGLPLINYLRYCPYPRPTPVLLSIRPEFASAIIRGEKRFEFRRCIFRRPVSVVVIYATSPVKHAIGEFDIKTVFYGQPKELWKKTNGAAGIDKTRFMK